MYHDPVQRDAGMLERFPELAATDEARRTLSWFLGRARDDGTLAEDWAESRSRMEEVNARNNVMRTVVIEHDFWICKRANPVPKPENLFRDFLTGGGSWNEQIWQPPAEWGEWPTFDAGSEEWLAHSGARRTHSLDGAVEPGWQGNADRERSRAAEVLLALAVRPRPVEMCVGNQALAWLDVALGRLGRVMHAGPGDVAPGVLLHDLGEHVLSPHSAVVATMMEDSLELLYGAVRTADGRLVSRPSPRGQSNEWRDYFKAFSRDLAREQVLASVQLASLLLRSDSVWQALSALRDYRGDRRADLRDVATCVRRRWYLALCSLAWLELSLLRPRPFETLRPADLACFAVAALLPLYPRPLVAVSHRSSDAKKQLMGGRAWGSNEVLVDATFRPEWQTNRAMLWSLFAATPVICTLRSPGYTESPWCRAEAEMFEHLAGTADFLAGRTLVEIDVAAAGLLDRAARSNPATHRVLEAAAGIDTPPLEIRKWDRWQGAMVRAVAATRFIHRVFVLTQVEGQGSPAEQTNRFLEVLCDPGAEPPEQSLFGFDRIWHRLAAALRADAAAVRLEPPLAVVSGSEAHDQAEGWFRRHAQWVSDLSGCGLEPGDLLAALDWRDYLEPFLRGYAEGSRYENQAAFLDLRGVTEDEWMTDPGWTVARGLIFLRLTYPLLVRQLAGQRADEWPLIRELDIPVFTQHLPEQGIPQSEVFFSLGGPWPVAYLNANSDYVSISPYLAYACEETLKLGSDPVMIRADKGLSALSLPGQGLEEWLREYNRKQEGVGEG
ncbi:MAG TPA: hypothetical protein VFJ16_09500 [Longimicrobium sp.]|nr:hypothetical protein [Longimicrobium sp.]